MCIRDRYGAIADALRARIADGTYPVGTKLPSITELMREFDVPGPVSYTHLGWIEVRSQNS